MKESAYFDKYNPIQGVWDEMYGADASVRNHYRKVIEYISNESADDLNKKEELAKRLFMSQGITFTVYNSGEGIENIFPFDIIRRMLTADEWAFVEKGIKQRLTALNLFLKDVYHNQFIINDGIVPIDIIYSCPHFLREMYQLQVPYDIYVHISGIDIIRDHDGTFYVLEDNLRTPSGVSYMLENREITKRLFPDLLPQCGVRSVTEYPTILYKNLLALSPRQIHNPTIVLLSPGIYNSAYFEHTTLARLMAVELVEGRDMVIDNHRVYMKTTSGLQQVDVIYRRVDDEFLDPLVFNPDSMLGVAGIMSAYRKGNVAIVNAAGNGVADDKAIYAFVPAMIRYYLNEEPILKNVPTYQLGNAEERDHVFSNMEKMVVKKTNESGGFWIVFGNFASIQETWRSKKRRPLEPTLQITHPAPNPTSPSPTSN